MLLLGDEENEEILFFCPERGEVGGLVTKLDSIPPPRLDSSREYPIWLRMEGTLLFASRENSRLPNLSPLLLFVVFGLAVAELDEEEDLLLLEGTRADVGGRGEECGCVAI